METATLLTIEEAFEKIRFYINIRIEAFKRCDKTELVNFKRELSIDNKTLYSANQRIENWMQEKGIKKASNCYYK
jgi:hypothetical protein